MNVRAILFLHFVCFGLSIAWAQNPIPVNIHDQELKFPIDDLWVFEDTLASLHITDILREDTQEQFKQSPPLGIRSNSAFWVRFQLSGEALRQKSWFLEGREPNTTHLDFYLPDSAGNYQAHKMGSALLFRKRPINHKNFFLELPNHTSNLQFYVRIQSKRKINFSFRLKDASYFAGYSINEYVLLGIFYGVLTIMALYNFLLFWFVRERLYLWYVGYVCSCAMVCLVEDGLGYQYLWFNYPFLTIYIEKLFGSLFLLFFLIYANSFLKLSEHLPRYFRFVQIITCISIPGIIFQENFFHNASAYVLFILPPILIFIAAWTRVRHEGMYLKLFIFGLSFVVLSMCLTMANKLISIDYDRLSETQLILFVYAFYIALIFEVVILSISQTHLLKVYQDEHAEVLTQQLAEIQRKNNTLQKYIQSNTELQNFATVASHDMKQPVRTIIAFSDLLEKKLQAKEALDPSIQQYLHFITSGSSYLDEMIKKLLAHARLGTGEEEVLEKISIQKIIERVKLTLSKQISETETLIQMDSMPVLYVEPTFIAQLFQNLISNAIKFRSLDRNCLIEITAKHEDPYWHFCVKDNGQGIPEERKDEVFKLFRKFPNDRKDPGHGIGLTTCKKIVEIHQGKIWVESKDQEGTHIHFTIYKHLDKKSFHAIIQDPSMESLSQ